VGEISFWYRPTRVVPDQRPLNGRCSNKQVVTGHHCYFMMVACKECTLPTMSQYNWLEGMAMKPLAGEGRFSSSCSLQCFDTNRWVFTNLASWFVGR